MKLRDALSSIVFLNDRLYIQHEIYNTAYVPLCFWESHHDSKSRVGPAITYVDCSMEDKGCSVVERKHCMLGRQL